MERLDVLIEGRTPEQADLGDIGRTVARIAALPFDRLDHRRLFAADIGSGAAAELDLAGLDETGLFERGDLMRQDVKHGGIFVAHIEIDALRLDPPGPDQRALEHGMRLPLEVIAVLKGAGFALVAIDGH